MFDRRRVAALAAAIGFACAPLSAFAQADFPNRPLKLLVPYAAGGGTDAIARLVAQAVSERLGQTLVVENNGTAGGNVDVAGPADGHAAQDEHRLHYA